MFDVLSSRFDDIFSRLRSRGRLSDADVDEVLREIRVALLEADVNLNVVRTLIEAIRVRCSGAELSKSLTPAQQVIKVVNEELTAVLGGEAFTFRYASRPPTIVLLAGLQGSGKTTTVAKLARYFIAQGRYPLLVAADLQRPGAVDQLRILGKEVGAAVFSEPTDPVAVARAGVKEAERVGRDVVIIDTAGRLTLDEALMEEVRAIADAVKPNYRFFVLDAMTGQDAVQTAVGFNEALALDGVILSKLDGDARGGAVLSVKYIVGKPIVFACTGERPEDFESFYPDRMAGRILGMGDVLSLIERAEQAFDETEARETADKIRKGRLNLNDFQRQIQQMKKMGPLQNVLGMMPGLPKEAKDAKVDDRDLARIEAIISSMTDAERDEPDLINGTRRLRIANGSGTTTSDVNNLLRQFKEMQKLMRSPGLLGQATRGSSRKNAKKSSRGKSRSR